MGATPRGWDPNLNPLNFSTVVAPVLKGAWSIGHAVHVKHLFFGERAQSYLWNG